jgi:hypothetical protein
MASMSLNTEKHNYAAHNPVCHHSSKFSSNNQHTCVDYLHNGTVVPKNFRRDKFLAIKYVHSGQSVL